MGVVVVLLGTVAVCIAGTTSADASAFSAAEHSVRFSTIMYITTSDADC